jgi:hypothetical protein
MVAWGDGFRPSSPTTPRSGSSAPSDERSPVSPGPKNCGLALCRPSSNWRHGGRPARPGHEYDRRIGEARLSDRQDHVRRSAPERLLGFTPGAVILKIIWRRNLNNKWRLADGSTRLLSCRYCRSITSVALSMHGAADAGVPDYSGVQRGRGRRSHCARAVRGAAGLRSLGVDLLDRVEHRG